MKEALDIHVTGIVQGVGFRPFVYKLAKKYLIDGWVLNAADGVSIHAEGEATPLDQFVIELSEHAPAAARISEIEMKEVPLEGFSDFEIRFSDASPKERTTFVSPDIATCNECESELFNPNNRRFRYPFINCTNCGPRFTIIDQLPYDRANTSMRSFTMCQPCQDEYDCPLDRRFHAQPNACFTCGPKLSFALTHGDECQEGERKSDDQQAVESSRNEMDEHQGDGNRDGEHRDVARQSGEHRGGELVAQFVYGETREESDALLARAVELLLSGHILAVKGLGGFHLVCDARNPQAVSQLRARKHRDHKPFAVMMHSIEDVRGVCALSAAEEKLLRSPERPIVLLKKLAAANFLEGVADKLSELGIMLPATPVQHLLMHDFAQRWYDEGNVEPPLLVMTSGNVHDEPIVISDEEAVARLSNIADAILGNNRPILARFDDSVVRVIRVGDEGDAVQFIRRARGYAPTPLSIPTILSTTCSDDDGVTDGDTNAYISSRDDESDVCHANDVSADSDTCDAKSLPTLLASGPEQKNTFCFAREGVAFVSQHIGDVESADTYDSWLATKRHFETLFQLKADVLACDLHPEYLTSKWAHEQGLPCTEVQHHHAHIASVLGEHALADAVCGIAFDGTGYGVDGAIWGGEVLLANAQAFERFANFAYVPLPGGTGAIKHPLRMAYGVLWAYDLLEHAGAARTLELLGPEAQNCETMIEQGINTPMTSSVGRLFDAASALCGVCTQPSYEGEGAVLFEAVLADDAAFDTYLLNSGHTRDEHVERYGVQVVKNTATEASTAEDTSVVLLDAERTFASLLDDLAASVPVGIIARHFHNAIVGAIVMSAELVRGLYDIQTVALSGGVFMNRYIIESALAQLEERGFTVAINRELPPNDGCISFGQAIVARAQEWLGSN